MKDLNRDSIDFGKTNIRKLFIKLFIPTLLGMLFMACFNIADGVIVGRGVGSDALASINIVGPLFLISNAFSMMFAAGVSIVAAVHLSQNNIKAANINVTQAFMVPLFIMAIVSIIVFCCPRELCFLFGGTEKLCPYVVDYMRNVFLMPMFTVILMVGGFVIRLDGSPQYAMYLNVVPSLLNMFLDWLFVFPLQFGIKGAAIATSISMGLGSVMVIYYLLFKTQTLHLYKLKCSLTSLYLTFRNSAYMMKLGLATFIGEGAISCMMIVGNYMFVKYLHEDGVAAFSVCCYLFPLVFMFGNSIAQSQLPIISYNYGANNKERISKTIRISMSLAFVCGMAMVLLGITSCHLLMSLFLTTGSNAYTIAIEGFPIFSISFLFFSLNLVAIGYYQSIEKSALSIFYMLLRGLIFIIPIFILLPKVWGYMGLWWAVPLSEAMAFVCICVGTLFKKEKIKDSKQLTNKQI